ncbi:MAG: NAD(P)H-dependent oxidoreductase [bacterium]|nr:NAD(P)H-dependent oxidoreductase [bacterium]
MFAFLRKSSGQPRKILILLGHPDKETTCGHLADSYETGARQAGHEVRRINIGELTFDPILHKGYKTVQELEPDLVMVQEAFKWAGHVVILYPNWWSSMPALLKGMFDRMFLPGFAYNFHQFGWDKLLKGKTGRVIITMDNWPLLARVMFGDYTNEITNAILGFSGIKPVHIWKVGPLKHMNEIEKNDCIDKAFALGGQAF